MARTNFQYEKRQRELEKKRKTEEKARRKAEAKHAPSGGEGQDEGDATADDAVAPEGEQQGQ
jgi:hypothetical protein